VRVAVSFPSTSRSSTGTSVTVTDAAPAGMVRVPAVKSKVVAVEEAA
jgi:hypothetical protein